MALAMTPTSLASRTSMTSPSAKPMKTRSLGTESSASRTAECMQAGQMWSRGQSHWAALPNLSKEAMKATPGILVSKSWRLNLVRRLLQTARKRRLPCCAAGGTLDTTFDPNLHALFHAITSSYPHCLQAPASSSLLARTCKYRAWSYPIGNASFCMSSTVVYQGLVSRTWTPLVSKLMSARLCFMPCSMTTENSGASHRTLNHASVPQVASELLIDIQTWSN